jgi:hypothetical protein
MAAAKAHSHWPISILSSASAILNMFVPLILVRILSPDDVGVFKIFFLYALMTPSISFTSGFCSGLGYWAGQGEIGRRAIRISNGFTIGAGFLLSLVFLAGAPWISAWFKWPLITLSISRFRFSARFA